MIFSILTVIWHNFINGLGFLSPGIRDWLNTNSWLAWLIAILLGFFVLSILFGGCGEYDPYY